MLEPPPFVNCTRRSCRFGLARPWSRGSCPGVPLGAMHECWDELSQYSACLIARGTPSAACSRWRGAADPAHTRRGSPFVVAKSAEEAIDKAETETTEYPEGLGEYLGFAQSFHVFDDPHRWVGGVLPGASQRPIPRSVHHPVLQHRCRTDRRVRRTSLARTRLSHLNPGRGRRQRQHPRPPAKGSQASTRPGD